MSAELHHEKNKLNRELRESLLWLRDIQWLVSRWPDCCTGLIIRDGAEDIGELVDWILYW